MSSENELRRRFNRNYFDNKAQIEQVKDKESRVDMCLLDKYDMPLLYIETKANNVIQTYDANAQGEFQDKQLRRSLAQIILTNRQQEKVYGIINKVAVAFEDDKGNDVLIYAIWNDNSVMGNDDINWRSERPSDPTQMAIDSIKWKVN